VEESVLSLFPFDDASAFFSDVFEFESFGVRYDDGCGEPLVLWVVDESLACARVPVSEFGDGSYDSEL